MFNLEDLAKVSGDFTQETSKFKYPEGDNEMRIVKIEPWANKQGAGIRFQGDNEKTLYLGFSRSKKIVTKAGKTIENGNFERDLKRFKRILEVTNTNYNPTTWRTDLIGKKLIVEIKWIDKKAFKFGEKLCFTVGELNIASGKFYANEADAITDEVEVIEFKQEQIIGLKESQLSKVEENGFNLEEDVPF